MAPRRIDSSNGYPAVWLALPFSVLFLLCNVYSPYASIAVTSSSRTIRIAFCFFFLFAFLGYMRAEHFVVVFLLFFIALFVNYFGFVCLFCCCCFFYIFFFFFFFFFFFLWIYILIQDHNCSKYFRRKVYREKHEMKYHWAE